MKVILPGTKFVFFCCKEPVVAGGCTSRQTASQILRQCVQGGRAPQDEHGHDGKRKEGLHRREQGSRRSLRTGLVCWAFGEYKIYIFIYVWSEIIKWVSEYRLLNVTINNISVIHVMAHRCAGDLKKLDLWSGTLVIDISLGSLTCPSKHQHGPPFLRLFQETALFQSPFTMVKHKTCSL